MPIQNKINQQEQRTEEQRTEQQNKLLGRIFRPLIDLLLFFDPLHCYTSYMAELTRRQLPENFLINK